jgi:biuret amidohydrolase
MMSSRSASRTILAESGKPLLDENPKGLATDRGISRNAQAPSFGRGMTTSCYGHFAALGHHFGPNLRRPSEMHIACARGQIYECEPNSSALLSIDFQEDFLGVAGYSAVRELPIERLRRAVDPARRVLLAARQSGIRVIHTRECYDPDLSNLNAFRKVRDTVVGSTGPLGRFLIRGERGTEIIPELRPLADEMVIDKPGLNSFFGTQLDQILKDCGISHLLIMGVTTQVCVASTLRGAVDQGYFPLLLSDCCAAWDEEDHDATLRVIYSENHQFGWVSDSERLVASLKASAPIATTG